MSGMDDSTDVPALEDMSELLKQMESLRESKGNKKTNEVAFTKQDVNGSRKEKKNEKISECVSSSIKQSLCDNSPTVSAKKTSSNFGGFKKGFLLGGSTNSNSSPKVKKENKESSAESIPLIKAKNTESENVLEMPEVQRKMTDSQSFLNNKDWMTDDLLMKLQKNEVLLKGLQDPRFMQAIGEFQSDPTAAMKKYESNEDVQTFLKQFCGLLGEHFTALGSEETPPKTNLQSVHVTEPKKSADIHVHSSSDPNQPTRADEEKMQEILSRPDMREVLVDPQIQQLIHNLKNNPDEAQRMLSMADLHMKNKIKKLVDAGMLQFQT